MDALYGGHTEAIRLHYRVKEGKKAKRYIDVMNLYHWIHKYLKFPVGYLTIHLECNDVEATLAKEGLLRYTVRPPRDLYRPVLPYRCLGRLIFCLCRVPSRARGSWRS
jgi:hypothetical protein